MARVYRITRPAATWRTRSYWYHDNRNESNGRLTCRRPISDVYNQAAIERILFACTPHIIKLCVLACGSNCKKMISSRMLQRSLAYSRLNWESWSCLIELSWAVPESCFIILISEHPRAHSSSRELYANLESSQPDSPKQLPAKLSCTTAMNREIASRCTGLIISAKSSSPGPPRQIEETWSSLQMAT